MHRSSPSLALSLLCLAASACIPDVKYCIGDCPQASGGSLTGDTTGDTPGDTTGSLTDSLTGDTASDTTSGTSSDSDSGPEPATTGAPLATCELVDTIETPATCTDQIQQPGELCFGFHDGSVGLPQGLVSTLPLAITDQHLTAIAIARGDGESEAHVFGPGPVSIVGWGPHSVDGPLTYTGSGDLNGDGIDDIVGIVDTDDDHAIISHLRADGEILATDVLLVAAHIYGAHVVDFDHDGDRDVVLISDLESNEHNFILYRNKGGGLASIEPLFGRAFAGGPHDVGALNLDGREDDFVFAAPGGGVDVHMVGPGDTIFTVPLDPAMAVRALEIADLDEDGRGDFVALVDDTTHGTTLVAVGLQTTDDLGDPTFSVAHYPVHCGAVAMTVGDVDADGHLDVVTAGPGLPVGLGTIRIGDGDGDLPGLKTVPLGTTVDTIHIVDFDQDGGPDLVSSSRAAGAIDYNPSAP